LQFYYIPVAVTFVQGMVRCR